MFNHSFLACTLFVYLFEVEISSHTLIPFFMPGLVNNVSASWDDCSRMFPNKLRLSLFPDRFPHYAWTVALSAHSDFVGLKVYACLGVTCHLHFWQGDWGLLCAAAVTWVEQTPNKSQHTKLILEKKIRPPLLLGFKLTTFQSQVRCSYQQAIPTHVTYLHVKRSSS